MITISIVQLIFVIVGLAELGVLAYLLWTSRRGYTHDRIGLMFFGPILVLLIAVTITLYGGIYWW